MTKTIFDKIVSGEIPSYKVWEDDNYLAFLTPFAVQPGQTVVIPKVNQADYVGKLSADQLTGLMVAVQTVMHLLEKAFNTKKVAVVFEGEGVPHVHAKLYPMQDGWQDNAAAIGTNFFEAYPGYIITTEGPQMSDERLQQIQQQIIGTNQ